MTANISQLFPTDADFMPVEVFIGGNGDLVLLQEFSREAGETFVRIIVRPDRVDALCSAIASARLEQGHR